MNAEQVMEKIQPATQVSLRTIEHGPETRVIVSPDGVGLRPSRNARVIDMSPEGARALARFASIPTAMAQCISPDTFGRVATEMLAAKQHYNLVLKDTRVEHVIEGGGRAALNPHKVLDRIGRVFHGCDFNRALVLGNYAVALEVVGVTEKAVAVGDLVRAGALVQFSPIGSISPTVQSFVMRLQCTNGQTSNEVYHQFGYGGEGDDPWQWFRESLRAAAGALGKIVQRWQQLRGEDIAPENRAQVLEAMLREMRASKEVVEAVRARAIEEPPRTAYDVMNLITWAGSHVAERPEEIMRAHRAVATFVSTDTHSRICPVCHRGG